MLLELLLKNWGENMTLNKKKKGERKELLAKKQLEKEGWTVVFKSCTVKRGPCFVGLDFADLFDVIGLDKHHKSWKFVSVKHYSSAQTKYPQHQQEIKDFATTHGLVGMIFELWLWHKPRWTGRGKNKRWDHAYFERIEILWGG